MSTTTKKPKEQPKIEFKAEVQQLLDIVIHSLYTDKEIFIRELISNSADSLEKMRFILLKDKEIYDEKKELEINITTDEKNNTITISDHGIGLTREELIENLGSIAHSGTKSFIEALKEQKKSDIKNNVIGKFGVGFYSSFMVAEEVKVHTHSYKKDGQNLVWTSNGKNNYSIEESTEKLDRGAKIVIKLKEEDKEFAKSDKVKEIIEKYSNYISFPVNLNGEKVNKISAIWLKNKNEVKKEEYEEFYKFQAKAWDTPQYTMHFNADAPLTINALIFIPSSNMEKFGMGRLDPGISLYSRKILIDSKPESLLPEWLRFLRGVIDSEDLPLSISRESMQDSNLVNKLKDIITKRFLKFLERESKKDDKKYLEFYKNFSRFLKEGIATDPNYKNEIAKLLRFQSSNTKDGELTSINQYIDRLKTKQENIYYTISTNGRSAIEEGPYIEAFKDRGLEVIFFEEQIDEYVMDNLKEFDGKKLIPVDDASIKLDDFPLIKETKKRKALSKKKTEELCTWIKENIDAKLDKVIVGTRLQNSPALILNANSGMNPRLMKMMQEIQGNNEQANSILQDSNLQLEINPSHPIIVKLNTLREKDEKFAKLITNQIYENSLMSANLLDNPKDSIKRIYQIIEKAL